MSSLVSAALEPSTKITCKKIGNVDLEMHVFNPKRDKSSDATPVIVFFFGGGWTGGLPKQFYPHCEYLASRGMVAIRAEYRIKKKHKTIPMECVMDGKSAIRWIRSHANRISYW